MAHTVIGTAGHIDHGKTLLVKALTGVDTDKAPEEKARGITIELGFAFLGESATIIDVPGHERFVKTMVAGVSTIDIALLVIAADDGVMPQSREHLDVLQLLEVPRGLIVLNKTDLAADDWLDLVEEEIRDLVSGTFLQDAAIARVSAVTGDGIEPLRELLTAMIAETGEKRIEGPFRMPVDRAFVVKGFGMVCTGTVLAGRLAASGAVQIQPAGSQLRIRGLQQHGHAVETVAAGDRAAVNLPGIDQHQIRRGDMLSENGVFRPTYMLDARLRLLPSSPKELVQRARVRVHIGTAEILARVVFLDRDLLRPGDSTFVQIRLESPVAAAWGDRFVIRRYSPALTIGGGQVLHPHPAKHGGRDAHTMAALERLDSGDAATAVLTRVDLASSGVIPLADLVADLGIGAERLGQLVGSLVDAGKVVEVAIDRQPGIVAAATWRRTEEHVAETLKTFHAQSPLQPGMNREELRATCGAGLEATLFERILEHMEAEKRTAAAGNAVRLAEHAISFSDDDAEMRERIEVELLRSTLEQMPDAGQLAQKLDAGINGVEALLRAMQNLGIVVYLDGTLVVHRQRIDSARIELRLFLERQQEITVSQFRELIGSNRRYALALLNHFDSEGLTVRQGDVRTLR